MRQELAFPRRLVIQRVGVLVLGDVGADQEHLLARDLDPGLLQRALAGAQALDLGTHQDEAHLQFVDDLVLVVGLAVLGDLPAFVLLGLHGLPGVDPGRRGVYPWDALGSRLPA